MWANIEDPDLMPHIVAANLDLHCFSMSYELDTFAYVP